MGEVSGPGSPGRTPARHEPQMHLTNMRLFRAMMTIDVHPVRLRWMPHHLVLQAMGSNHSG